MVLYILRACAYFPVLFQRGEDSLPVLCSWCTGCGRWRGPQGGKWRQKNVQTHTIGMTLWSGLSTGRLSIPAFCNHKSLQRPMSWKLIIWPASSQRYFKSATWSTSSQYLQHFVTLQQQQFNPCLGFGQCLLSSLEMVLIIWAQEPIMANTILSTSHPRMRWAMDSALLQLYLPRGPVRLLNHPWCE